MSMTEAGIAVAALAGLNVIEVCMKKQAAEICA
jgi:hypothetical protein